MQVLFVTVDVFTDRTFGGNPLAVFPDARELSDAHMQAIAREINYSEHVFVMPAQNPAHTAQLRIFTPTSEIPFAGHPNVGTAFVLARLGAALASPVGETLVFEEGAGVVQAEVLRSDGVVTGARITAPQPLMLGPEIPAEVLAPCVGLELADLAKATHPPRLASVGLPQVFVELSDLSTLARARPNAGAFASAEADLPLGGGPLLTMLWVRTGPGSIRARMFGPTVGVPEDPATGSAAGALGALLASRGEGTEYLVEQGSEIGRPSRIDVTVRNNSASIAGACVPVIEGIFRL